jgi:hypothetical protein
MKNRIMIYGPKEDGTYVVEFMTSDGDVLGYLDSKKRSACHSAFPRENAV